MLSETYDQQLSRIRFVARSNGLPQATHAALVAVLKRLDDLETALVQQQTRSHCSYCSHVTAREGRTQEEFWAAMREHILECENRPEKKLANAILSITIPLGVDLEGLEPKDIDGLVSRIDKRWKEVMAMIPTVEEYAVTKAAVDFIEGSYFDCRDMEGSQSMDVPVTMMNLYDRVLLLVRSKTPTTPSELVIAEHEHTRETLIARVD